MAASATCNPITLHIPIPPSPVYDSGEETQASIQGYPTDIAKDSDDVFSSSDSESELDVSIPFKKAFKENRATILDSDIEVVEAMITNCYESDVSFWADQSDDQLSDHELSTLDHFKWGLGLQCPTQSLYTAPSLMKPVLPVRPKKKKHRLSKKQRRALQQSSWKLSCLLSAPSTQELTIQTTETREDSFVSTTEKCIICLDKEVNALMLHGKTAHRVCCYQCARKLEKKSPLCPVCRQSMTVVQLMKRKRTVPLSNQESASQCASSSQSQETLFS